MTVQACVEATISHINQDFQFVAKAKKNGPTCFSRNSLSSQNPSPHPCDSLLADSFLGSIEMFVIFIDSPILTHFTGFASVAVGTLFTLSAAACARLRSRPFVASKY